MRALSAIFACGTLLVFSAGDEDGNLNGWRAARFLCGLACMYGLVFVAVLVAGESR